MAIRQQKVERAQDIARHPWKNAEVALAHQRPDGVIGEWKNVEPEDQNFFQRWADRTHGILAPANPVTIAGGLLTAAGIVQSYKGNHVKAAIYKFVGRFGGDIGDGWIAAITETRGAPGAFLDAVVDKALAAAEVSVAVTKGDISTPEAVTHALQQARSARENMRLKLAGGEPNPSKFGKWGQASLWLELGGLTTAHAAEDLAMPQAASVLRAGSEIAKHAAIILNERAADEYERRRIDHVAQTAITASRG